MTFYRSPATVQVPRRHTRSTMEADTGASDRAGAGDYRQVDTALTSCAEPRPWSGPAAPPRRPLRCRRAGPRLRRRRRRRSGPAPWSAAASARGAARRQRCRRRRHACGCGSPLRQDIAVCHVSRCVWPKVKMRSASARGICQGGVHATPAWAGVGAAPMADAAAEHDTTRGRAACAQRPSCPHQCLCPASSACARRACPT